MMNFALVRRLALAVLVVACVACGGGGDDKAADDGSNSASGGTTTTALPGEAPPPSTDAAATPADQSSSETVDTQPPADQATTSVPNGGGGGPAGPAPIQPGTYLYTQNGSFKAGLFPPFTVPPQGKLVVDAAQTDGTQVSHRYIDPQQPPSDTTVRFGADGMFVVSTTLRAQGGIVVTCTFNPGVPAPPWPPTVGATISGHGDCGKDGTADISGSITGTTTATVGGTQFDAFVVETTIVANGKDLKANVHVTAWFAPSLRLIVHDQTNQNGTYQGTQFSGSSSSDLISATPS